VSARECHHTGTASFFSASLVGTTARMDGRNASVTLGRGAAVPALLAGLPRSRQASPGFDTAGRTGVNFHDQRRHTFANTTRLPYRTQMY